jgi:UDP-N-acetylglucosamine 2-epimerase (non-hydrolysing)
MRPVDDGRAAVVLGTRPEIIKLAGVIRALGERGYIVHSGQHYDDSLSAAFFANYELPPPAVELDGVGGQSRGHQFATIISELTRRFTTNRPGAVIVQGDTNTAAAAAQAASFLEIPVVHVEAGLRSFDRAMPEEINRQIIGVVAELHCAPTEEAVSHLLREGVAAERILLTGNTVVEATLFSLPEPAVRARLLSHYGVAADDFVLATVHRPENTDDPERLAAILRALVSLDVPVLLPLHPRTRAAAQRFGLLKQLDALRTVTPFDHPTFLGLAAHARLLVSDSGGVQEECTVLKRPLIVLRNSSERPEAIAAGFARRLVPDPTLPAVLRAALADAQWLPALADRPSPYGDGTASAQIAAAVLDMFLTRSAQTSKDHTPGG